MNYFIHPANVEIRDVYMKISYKKLWILLIQKDITKVTLRQDVGISAGAMSKLPQHD